MPERALKEQDLSFKGIFAAKVSKVEAKPLL